MLKPLVLITAIIYTSFITILNFINLKSIPQVGLGFEDKIYHVGAYMVFSFLWASWLLISDRKSALKWLLIFCLAYGIALEFLQQIINPSRTFDLLDLTSNCFGVIFGIIIARWFIKQNVKLN